MYIYVYKLVLSISVSYIITYHDVTIYISYDNSILHISIYIYIYMYIYIYIFNKINLNRKSEFSY